MTPKEFIISKLKAFILAFPNAKVRYEADYRIDTHFVEVLPNSLYNLDKRYIEWESGMFENFIELYPAESISFITDDALVKLDNVCFEICGSEYEQFEYYSTNNNEVVNIAESYVKVSAFSLSVIPSKVALSNVSDVLVKRWSDISEVNSYIIPQAS